MGNLPAFSEQKHWCKKTFPMKMLDLPDLNFAHLYLGVGNGEGWVGKAMVEDIIASPLSLRAEAELGANN